MTSSESWQWIEGGGLTSPMGFLAGATYAEIKTYGDEPRLDLGILFSEVPAVTAGVFTTNKVPGAPVILCRSRLAQQRISRGIVTNSGCSNVATGLPGVEDAEKMAALAALHTGVSADQFLVASTGVIGRRLPMAKLEKGIPQINLSADGGHALARAMMTTDTVDKQRALSVKIGERSYTIGGAAKGAGMSHPNMATVFCFLSTDAPVEAEWLQSILKSVCDDTINMVDVDMDTSTSDSMIILANGVAGGDVLCASHPGAAIFESALKAICEQLAIELARDGEGARTLITAHVEGARTHEDARLAARTIVSSPLVKTMITGRDPNPGRVMMAVGRSGADVEPERISVFIGEHCAFNAGSPSDVSYAVISKAMDVPEVEIRVDLGLGTARATAWGCDLTVDYVHINADYTT